MYLRIRHPFPPVLRLIQGTNEETVERGDEHERQQSEENRGKPVKDRRIRFILSQIRRLRVYPVYLFTARHIAGGILTHRKITAIVQKNHRLRFLRRTIIERLHSPSIHAFFCAIISFINSFTVF